MVKSSTFKSATPVRIVTTGVQAKRTITTIPRDFADRLGIVEGLTLLQVSIENGALVYRLKSVGEIT